MKLILLINFLLLTTLSFATENRYQYMKLKVNSNNNITTVKFLAKNPMIGDERYPNQKDLEENYITHITASDSDKVLLDISTSNYLIENLIFQHRFIDIRQSKKIRYEFTDNNKNQKKYLVDTSKRRRKVSSSIVVTPLKREKIVDYRKLKPKVFKSINIDEAIEELYGVVNNPIEGKINLSGPESSYCHMDIPIHISSDVDLESLAIFNDKNKYPTIAVFSIPEESIIDFKFRIKMFQACTDYSIILIGKDRNGNIYKTSVKGHIACADGCGGGG